MRSVTNNVPQRDRWPSDTLPTKSKRRPQSSLAGAAACGGAVPCSSSMSSTQHDSDAENAPLKRVRVGSAVPAAAGGGGDAAFASSAAALSATKDAAATTTSTPNSVADSPLGDCPATDSAPPQLPRNTGLEDLAANYTLGRVLGEGTYG